MPLDLGTVRDREEPVGDEATLVRRLFQGDFEQGRPDVGSGATEDVGAVLRRDVLAYGVALVAVDAAFALLEIDGVRR